MLNKCLFPTTDVLIRFSSAAFVIVLTACQSDEARYAELNRAVLIARLPVDYARQAQAEGKPQCPELVSLPTNEYLAACSKQLEADEARLDLAERDLNKFMHR